MSCFISSICFYWVHIHSQIGLVTLIDNNSKFSAMLFHFSWMVPDPLFPNPCTSLTLQATASAMWRTSGSNLPFTSLWNIPASVEFHSMMHCIHGSRTLSTVSKSCLRVVDPVFPSDLRLVNTLPQFSLSHIFLSFFFQWPGYRQWSRQIPTKDFRSPPGPITIAKLAKNVAKCVQRFMLVSTSSFMFLPFFSWHYLKDRKMLPMEDGSDEKWRIGDRHGDIKVEDLMLVSIHHVSLGSWQPHLRLRRPRPISNNRVRSSPVEFPTSGIPIHHSPVEFSNSNIHIRSSPVEFPTNSNVLFSSF